jgi:hypothetical protein
MNADTYTDSVAILRAVPNETIYSFIDLAGLRRYLIDCPNMLVMFEVLINHIHEYKTLKNTHMNSLSSSAPI